MIHKPTTTDAQRVILAAHLSALYRRASIAEGGRNYDLALQYMEQHDDLFHAIQRDTSPATYGAATSRDRARIAAALDHPLA